MEMQNSKKGQENLMRAELFRLSRQGWKWLAFPAVFFWIAAVCLGFFTLEGMRRIYQENTEPVMITASTEEQNIDFSAVEGILDWTEVYEISGNLQIAGFSKECTIIGIDSSFFSEKIKEGSAYPQSSTMPYLAVNEAFLKELKDSSGNKIEENKIGNDSLSDWLSKSAEFVYGNDLKVICKISAILKDTGEEDGPKVYMSAASAKALLLVEENHSEEQSVRLKIENTGMYEKVRSVLNGLRVWPEDLEETLLWSVKMEKMRTELLCLCACLAGLAAWLMFNQSLKMDFIRNEKEYRYIHTVDTSLPDIHKQINRYRRIWFFLEGSVVGGAIYACWPIFAAMTAVS